MPITVTCPNPACGQVCAVQDQYAGMQVSCPKCQTVFAVPAQAAPVAAAAPPAAPVASAMAGGQAPFPSGPGMAGLMDNLTRLAGNPLAKNLVFAGLGCLVAMVLFSLFPWTSAAGGVGDFRVSRSVSGIQTGPGIITLLFSIAAAAFVIVCIVLNRADLFNFSVWGSAGVSVLIVLLTLINVISSDRISMPGMSAGPSIGLYLTLLASLGGAGTFGFLAFQRLANRPPEAPPPTA